MSIFTQLTRQLAEKGLALAISGQELRIVGSLSGVPASLLAQVKKHKAALLIELKKSETSKQKIETEDNIEMHDSALLTEFENGAEWVPPLTRTTTEEADSARQGMHKVLLSGTCPDCHGLLVWGHPFFVLLYRCDVCHLIFNIADWATDRGGN